MNRLVWVRLLFRAMGVLFIGMALPMCVQFVGQMVSFAGSAQMRSSWMTDWWQLFYSTSWGAGGLLQLAVGVYLLAYGKRLREWCMRDVEGFCPRCDYECGKTAAVCPECGLPLAQDSATAVPSAASQQQTARPGQG